MIRNITTECILRIIMVVLGSLLPDKGSPVDILPTMTPTIVPRFLMDKVDRIGDTFIFFSLAFVPAWRSTSLSLSLTFFIFFSLSLSFSLFHFRQSVWPSTYPTRLFSIACHLFSVRVCH